MSRNAERWSSNNGHKEVIQEFWAEFSTTYLTNHAPITKDSAPVILHLFIEATHLSAIAALVSALTDALQFILAAFQAK